jgi:hypothetical protein
MPTLSPRPPELNEVMSHDDPQRAAPARRGMPERFTDELERWVEREACLTLDP